MNWRKSIFIAGLGLGATVLAAPPTTMPSDIDALIRHLGDEDFTSRQSAVQRLREIGKPAIPALRAATENPDTEIQLRADELVKEIQRPPIPMDTPQPPAAGNGGFYEQTYHADERDGVRIVDATDNGRSIHIERYPTSVHMTIKGSIDGKPATREYKWSLLADLRQANSQAYALYLAYIRPPTPEMENLQVRVQAAQRAAMQRAQIMAQLRARGAVGGLPIMPPMGPGGFLPLPPVGIQVPQGNDELNGVEEKLLDEMRAHNVPPPQQDQVMDLLRQLRAARPQVIDPAQIDAQMAEFRLRSDALRKKLVELGVAVPKALPDGNGK